MTVSFSPEKNGYTLRPLFFPPFSFSLLDISVVHKYIVKHLVQYDVVDIVWYEPPPIYLITIDPSSPVLISGRCLHSSYFPTIVRLPFFLIVLSFLSIFPPLSLPHTHSVMVLAMEHS